MNKYQLAVLKWKEENPNKRYLDVPVQAIVEVKGYGLIKIGTKIKTIRSIYQAMQKGKRYGANKELTEEEIKWYNQHGMIWYNDKFQDEVLKKAILKWKKEHPDKKYLDISRNDVIELDGIGPIKIGHKINIIRTTYQAMQKGNKSCSYKNLTSDKIDWLNSQGMIWDYNKHQKKMFRKAILQWKKEHPNKKYLDISESDTIFLEGIGLINIGSKLKTKRNIYQAMQKGERFGQCNDLTPEEIEWLNDQGMIWDYSKYQENSNKNSEKDINLTSENEDNETQSHIEKILQVLKNRKTNKDDLNFNYDRLKTEFGLDDEALKKQFARIKNARYKRDETLSHEDDTLKSFCDLEGYNYEIIANAIKLHTIFPEDSLESIMNRVIIDYKLQSQYTISTWIYEKYGNDIKNILAKLNLSSTKILKDMSEKVLTIEEAISKDIFSRSIYGEKDQAWLENVYNYLIEKFDFKKINDHSTENIYALSMLIMEELELTPREKDVVFTAFNKYISTINEYHLYDVGLETDEDVRLQKIIDYGLDDQEVEKSFFKPLEFDQKDLLGRKKEMQKRRQILKMYTTYWDYYNQADKEAIIKQNNFTGLEVNYLNTARKTINKTLETVKTMKKTA